MRHVDDKAWLQAAPIFPRGGRVTRTQRLIAILGCAALAVGAADIALCQFLGGILRARFAAWEHAMAAQGFTIRHGALQRVNYPWGVQLQAPGFAVSGGRAMVPGGIAWGTERLSLALALWAPDQIAVSAAGSQILRLAGGPEISFFAERLNAAVPLGSGGADSIDIGARNLDARWVWRGQPQDLRLGTIKLALSAERGGAARTSARLSISAAQIVLPDDGRFPLGGTITQAAAVISLASPALSGETAADQARAWHDWGGLLTLESGSLRWGPLSVAAVAELGLDAQLQPEGSGTMRVGGSDATLDALSRAGLLPAGVAQTAKIVLGTMPREAGNTVVLPFMLQNSILLVARAPIAQFEQIRWGRVPASPPAPH